MYRVIERNDGQDREHKRFESAYEAAAYITSAWIREDAAAGRLYVVDEDGTNLVEPFDAFPRVAPLYAA